MHDDTAPTIASVSATWWHATIAPPGSKANAVRARLRRCTTPVEALLVEETHDLARRLAGTGIDPTRNPAQLAAIAITLAHVDTAGHQRVAKLFAGDDKRRALSQIRFQKLLQSEDAMEISRRLVRVLPMIDRNAHIASLANDIFYWGDAVRTRWTFDYFG